MSLASKSASQWLRGAATVTSSIRSVRRCRLSTRAGAVGELGQGAPLGMAEHVAQAPEQALVGGAERDVAVGAADCLIRRDHPVRRSQRLRDPDPGEVLGRLPDRKRHAGIDERRVDLLADAAPMAILDGGENADQREQPRAQVGQRYAGLDGRAAGLARDRHDARHALCNQIESALGAVGAGLSVSEIDA
jgi:hypothetical protein